MESGLITPLALIGTGAGMGVTSQGRSLDRRRPTSRKGYARQYRPSNEGLGITTPERSKGSGSANTSTIISFNLRNLR